jgi:phosphate transport system ATP-binding protein
VTSGDEHEPRAGAQVLDRAAPEPVPPPPPVLAAHRVTIAHGGTPVLADLDLEVLPGTITAVIGPSGCGKSSLLRAWNRTLELTPGASVTGRLTYHGEDLYHRRVSPTEVRRRVGLVAGAPAPLDTSIQANVAFGLRLHGQRRDLEVRTERALRQVGLWDQVARALDAPARALSLGQQQRLCMARTLASGPDVLLLDDPTSALDAPATYRIEGLLRELRATMPIVLVTHDLQQAARVSDLTAFVDLVAEPDGSRVGRLVEVDDTARVFTRSRHPRTEAYLTGHG